MSCHFKNSRNYSATFFAAENHPPVSGASPVANTEVAEHSIFLLFPARIFSAIRHLVDFCGK
jgi:hypothetical protein